MTPDPTINVGPEQTETKTKTTVSINPVVKIVSVKTWFISQEIIYNKVTTTEVEEIPEDDESNQIPEEPKAEHNYILDSTPVSPTGSKSYVYKSEINRKVDQKQSIKITTTKETYQAGITKEPEDKAEEFIELLKKPFKY